MHAIKLLLLIELTACGGRTELMGGADDKPAAGGSGPVTSLANQTGGAPWTAGGGASGSAATGGSQPQHKIARAVATGAMHTCAVLSDGHIECWGMNDSGELGDGTLIDRNLPASVQGVSSASLVATAFNHTCAVMSAGEVKCWGSNAYGQLGNGTSADSPLPLTVPGLTSIVGVDVGGLPGHTCALTNSGRVFCWGSAYSDPNNPDNAKLAAPALVASLSSATVISVGIAHSCTVVSSGAIYCWGANDYGQLGNGSVAAAAEPTLVQTDSGNAAVLLAAGGNDTCAIMAGGQVQCWGSNSAGQLGSALAPAGAWFASTRPLTVDQIGSAARIAVGSRHACVVLQNGTVQCWGGNSSGQLGDGTTNDSNQPVTAIGITNASGVAAGGNHTCAVIEDGTLLCWGSNSFGQLGDGTIDDHWLPARVVGF